MGYRSKRETTRTEKKLTQAEQNLLDTQDLAAGLYEENLKLKADLLDTQELLTTVIEKGGVV